jgi:hypothetical protein
MVKLYLINNNKLSFLIIINSLNALECKNCDLTDAALRRDSTSLCVKVERRLASSLDVALRRGRTPPYVEALDKASFDNQWQVVNNGACDIQQRAPV